MSFSRCRRDSPRQTSSIELANTFAVFVSPS